MTIRIKDLDFIHQYDQKVKVSDPSIKREVFSPNMVCYYYIPEHDSEHPGFYFQFMEFCSGEGDWGPNTEVEYVMHGVSYFDGVRHLYFGDASTENEGYLYYPNLPELIKAIEWLQKMEDRYCYQHSWTPPLQ